MNYMITSPERMILESLNKSSKNLKEIHNCTSLDPQLIQNVLTNLLSRNMVRTHNQVYQLNKNAPECYINDLNEKESKIFEAQTLIETCIEQSIEGQNSLFKFKKIYLSPRDKKMLQAMLINIETFLNNVNKNDKASTKDESIIFWGSAIYGNLLEDLVND